jgi:hypothetical protein
LGRFFACLLVVQVSSVRAQDIEPRAFSNAPVGVNFLIAGYAYTRGGLAFDSSVPITNPQLETSSATGASAGRWLCPSMRTIPSSSMRAPASPPAPGTIST